MATTVLIVDDHSAFRSRARRMLEADGFEVVGEAADGASGVDARGFVSKAELSGAAIEELLP